MAKKGVKKGRKCLKMGSGTDSGFIRNYLKSELIYTQITESQNKRVKKGVQKVGRKWAKKVVFYPKNGQKRGLKPGVNIWVQFIFLSHLNVSRKGSKNGPKMGPELKSEKISFGRDSLET